MNNIPTYKHSQESRQHNPSQLTVLTNPQGRVAGSLTNNATLSQPTIANPITL